MASCTYESLRLVFGGVLAGTLLYSIAIICLGIWILSDPTLMSYWLNRIVVSDYGALTVTLRMTSYLPIGLGLVATLSFSLGVLHLLRGSRRPLIAYAVATGLAGVLELVLTLVPMAMWQQVALELPQYLRATLRAEYRGLPSGQSAPNSIVWDAMQIELQCCGFGGVADYTRDYATMAKLWHSSHRFYTADGVSYSGLAVMFPVSCCKFADYGIITSSDFGNYERYVANKRCPVDGVDYFSNSCQQPLEDYVRVYFSVVLAAACVMLVLHIVGLALSAYLLLNSMVAERAETYSLMHRAASSLSLKVLNSGKVSPQQQLPTRQRRPPQPRQRHRPQRSWDV